TNSGSAAGQTRRRLVTPPFAWGGGGVAPPAAEPQTLGEGGDGCPHTLPFGGGWPAMSLRSSVPALLWWLFWILVALLLVILAALIIHHFGGFDLSFHLGDFHFDLGVTGH